MKDKRLQDPLHDILERHLFRSSTENETSSHMIDLVIQDYLSYLHTHGAPIPAKFREALIEDLREEITELTVRKTFGAIGISREPTDKKPVPRVQRKLI